MAFVVGLTGGIASGKTTVADLFWEQFAIDIVDADIIARDVVKPHSQGLQQIVARYGSQILHNGELDRRQLRQRIFDDEGEQKWLNALLHPLINAEIIQQIQQCCSPYILLVVPLLIESNMQTLCDKIVVVDVDEQTQITRTTVRDDVSIEQVKSILSAQATRQQRLKHADFIIDNNHEQQQLLPQITKIHKKLLKLSHIDSQ